MDLICRVLALSDSAAGNVRQAMALAQALDPSAGFAPLDVARPWRWLAPWGSRFVRPPALALASGGMLIAVACGRQGALVLRALRRHLGPRLYAIQILDPRCDDRDFDVLVLPEHDARRGKSVIHLLGSVHDIDTQWLEAARSSPRAIPADGTERVVVLLGGPTRAHPLDAFYLRRLRSDLNAWIEQGRGIAAICASRRTPSTLRESLRAMAREFGARIWCDAADGDNPYAAWLASADRLVVSPDSVNLLSEACAVGVPVHSLVTTALSGKLQRFHQSLRARGLLGDMQQDLRPRPPLRELPALVARIRERLPEAWQAGLSQSADDGRST